MESFVSTLLKTADLTVMTKKLVRVKYKEHIGRDLSTDEKETINAIVYKFVSESAAKQRSSESSSPGTDKSLSPGDKENRAGARPRQIILKGQVINKKDLKKVNRQPKQSEKRAKRKVYEPVKTYPKRQRTPRLEFADVMTAVLDSDNMVSSDHDDSQDTDRSDHGDEADDKSEESDIEPSEDVKKAVSKLKEERDKKIQMSQEKKLKFAKGTSVKETARRSLYGADRVNTLKQEEQENSANSSVILISDDSDFPPVQAKQNKPSCDKTLQQTSIPKDIKKTQVKSDKNNSGSLTVFRETYTSKKRKFSKFRNLDGSSSDSDSNPVTVNKTPDTYARKRKKKLLSREGRNSSAKSQSKTKPQTGVFDSDSDSEMDVPLAKRRRVSKQNNIESSAANGIPGTRKDKESDYDLPDIDGHDNRNPLGDVSDSDLSTGDTPLARKQLTLHSESRKHNTADTGFESDSSTGDTPLANKFDNKREKRVKAVTDRQVTSHRSSTSDGKISSARKEIITIDTVSESELSTGDTPLARKGKMFAGKSKISVTADSDSDVSTGDTPLARKAQAAVKNKKLVTANIDSDTEISTDDTPLARKSKTFRRKQKKIESDSELSTGDMPLARKGFKAQPRECITIVTEDTDSDSKLSTGDTPLARKSKAKLRKSKKQVTAESDSELSTGDTPLARKSRTKYRKSKESVAVEPDSEAESSTGDIPLVRKRKIFIRKQKKIDSDSELSTGDTPLARKSKAKSGKSKYSVDTDTDSQLSTGDTPLVVKNKTFIRKPETVDSDSDSELSTGDTPLARKSKAKPGKSTKNVSADTESESKTGDTPLARKSKTLVEKYKKIESDSELSTGDTPLARKNKANLRKSVDLVTIDTDSDSQLSTDDTPVKSVKSKTFIRNHKTGESDSELSTGDTPIARKSKAKPRESKITAIKDKDSETEFSKCDTPVARNRKTSYKSTDNDLIQNSKSLNGKNKPSQTIAVTSDSDLSAEETSLADNLCSDDGGNVTDSDDRSVYSDGNSDSSSNYVPLGGKKKLSDSEMDSDSDKCLEKSPFTNNQRCTSDSEQSNDDTPVKKKRSQNHGQKKRLVEISEDETPKKKKPPKAKVGRLTATKVNGVGKHASDTDSDDSEDMPLSKLNKSSESHRKEPDSSDSDEDQPLSKVKSKVKKAQQERKITKKSNVEEESKHLKQLRKICRACGMFIRNDRELLGCSTDKQKVARLKEHLQQAGMKGQPSMKKAEEIRLQKEAAQLNESNIISDEPSRGKRKVKSMYSRRVASPKKAPSPKKQMKNVFESLQGIVDSEGSGED